jgi:hypothetical protein
MEETDTDKETLGIYVSAGRFKAIVDMMDSDITIASDGEKMSISSAIGKQFVGLMYPLDQGVIIPKGVWGPISLPHLKRLLTLVPADQLRREEMASLAEIEAGKKLPPEIMELTIKLYFGSVEFALDFNQFTFDEVKLNLPAEHSGYKETIVRTSLRPRLSRAIKKQKLPEPDHKLNTVEIGKQRDIEHKAPAEDIVMH